MFKLVGWLTITLKWLPCFTGMKIGYFHISRSIPRMFNWASRENQLDGAVASGHTIWASPVVSKEKSLVGLCYSKTFETCNTWFFNLIAASFTVFCRQHCSLKCQIPQVQGRFLFLFVLFLSHQHRNYYLGNKRE